MASEPSSNSESGVPLGSVNNNTSVPTVTSAPANNNATPESALSTPAPNASNEMNVPIAPNLRANMNESLPAVGQTSTVVKGPTRSQKQKEADEGQAEMLQKIRTMYDEEFADVPEKYKPKAKAWVARAAYYKPVEEQDAYIRKMIRVDRNAVAARMAPKAKRVNYNANNADDESSSDEESDANAMNGVPVLTNKVHIHGMANALKAQASEAVAKLEGMVDSNEEKMLARAKSATDRVNVRKFATLTRKTARDLGKEVRSQATKLEHVAKQHLRQGATDVLGKMKINAIDNLEHSVSKKASKRKTGRKTMKRNSANVEPVMPLRTGDIDRNLNNTSINPYNNSNSVSSGLKNMSPNSNNSNNSNYNPNTNSNINSNNSSNSKSAKNNASVKSEAGQSVNTSIKSGRSFKDPYANNRSGANIKPTPNTSPVANNSLRSKNRAKSNNKSNKGYSERSGANINKATPNTTQTASLNAV